MLNYPTWKKALVLIVCLAGIILASPNVIHPAEEGEPFLGLNTINLGLDLQGGSYLLLEVDADHYLHDQQ